MKITEAIIIILVAINILFTLIYNATLVDLNRQLESYPSDVIIQCNADKAANDN